MEFSTEYIRRLESHNIAIWREIAELSTRNGSGMRGGAFDSGAVLRWPEVASILFNQICGVGRSGRVDREALWRHVGAFEAAGTPWWITLPPDLADIELIGELELHGFTRAAPWPVLGLMPEHWHAPSTNAAILVQEVSGDQPDLFGLMTAAFEMTPAFEPWLRTLAGMDIIRNFVATVDGTPAGVGMLATSGGVAGLYTGGVIPEFRRIGVHAALIGARVAAARTAGIDLMFSQTESDFNQSFRDLTRQGFAIAYFHEHWSTTSGRNTEE